MSALSYSSLHTDFVVNTPYLRNSPLEIVYSLPVCLKRADGIYDAFFIYSYPNTDKPDPTRPFAWVAFAADGRPNQVFNWCSITDFISTKQYPLGGTVSALLPSAISPEQQLASYATVVDMYERIRSFAFTKEPTVAQFQDIATYKIAFIEIVPLGLYPFYEALSPEFFHWLRLPLTTASPVPPKPSASKETAILAELTKLSHQIAEQIAQQQQDNTLLDSLHQELQEHRKNFLSQLTQPLERDVIMIIDTLQKSIGKFTQAEFSPENYQRLLHLFGGVEEDLTDLLYRQGVDPYVVTDGTITLPEQKVIATVPTYDQSLDKTVAARMAGGWKKQDRIIRPEYVSAYLYQAPNTAQADNGKGEEAN